ncbi:MAG: hypothetical protein IJ489_00125 [Clostridia bacterium]|nr:hypothetical protein [Clostridia bacterium]
MKLAVIGSRMLLIENIEMYMPLGITEIVSGGAIGIDTSAAAYAKKKGIPLKEFLPEYTRYKRAAPLIRNQKIAEYADEALAFWDGKSRGTKYTVDLFKKYNKKVTLILIKN